MVRKRKEQIPYPLFKEDAQRICDNIKEEVKKIEGKEEEVCKITNYYVYVYKEYVDLLASYDYPLALELKRKFSEGIYYYFFWIKM
jgi:glucosamine 6-phosphate synthetase-like amidotransferase/phosphosugar isomerase protein